MPQYRIIKRNTEFRVQSRHWGFWITRSEGYSEYWARKALAGLQEFDSERKKTSDSKWEVVALEVSDE